MELRARGKGELLQHTMLKELLDHIVPKNISHELQSRGQYLLEDQLLLSILSSLKFLLDEPRPMLITTKLHNVAHNVLL